MRGIIIARVAMVILLAGCTKTVYVQATPSANTPPSGSPSVFAATPSPLASPSPSPSPAAVLDGTYGLRSCDLNLFTHGFNTSTLIGSVELKNTGTVPAKITTNFWWLMGDGSKLAAKTLTVTLNPGKSRLVFFKMDVGQTVVDNFQSHPDYNRSKNCKTKASIDNA